MSGIHDQDRIDELRKRLYERGKPPAPVEKHTLSDEPVAVATDWKKPPEPKRDIPTVAQPSMSGANAAPGADNASATPGATLYPVKKRRGYRIKMVIIGFLFLLISVGLSSIFLMRGTNVISGDNISMAVTGPFTIGGGESIPVQVGITNNNGVPIQSATLIVDYPEGTKSPTETNVDLFSERLPLDTIAPGETLNVPLRALVFGEENDEKEIKVSIEYRVAGSNALFFKEADSLKFKIGSSPIRLSVENNIKISSGQETDIEITITSNSPTELNDIVIKADYPNAFDFVRSDPNPVLAQNIWQIDSLKPEETKTITLTGILFGRETEEYAINLTVGIPTERSQQTLASIFATEQIDFLIEQPFINIDLSVSGQSGDQIAVPPEREAGVVVVIENTLEETIYDAVINVQLSGNALSDVDVRVINGFYNSSNNTLSFDVGDVPGLGQITPGTKERVSFTIIPDTSINRTPQIDINVNVSARRVTEANVTEQLEGTAAASVKVLSTPTIAADAGYNNSVFTDSGPIPPEAETETTYTISLMVENGSNEITDTEIAASLPPYARWVDQTAGSGNVSFNPTNRVVTWRAGTVEANASAIASFQISFLPSQTQIGTTPTLLGEQRLSATDRFTGSVVRDTNPALTTELSSEAGFGQENGEVQP